jgi:hypothetical protein
MITRELANLMADLVRRMNRVEARAGLPANWRFEDRDAAPGQPAGLYLVGPNGTATFLGAR